MPEILSSEELQELIYLIRKTLLDFDYRTINNVIFFNNESVYQFLQSLTCAPMLSVSDILDTIEPYIPLALTEESISLLMGCNDFTNDVSRLEQRFSKNARMDFINLLTTTSNDDEWKNILDVCEKIRQFKKFSDEPVLV